MIYTIVIIDADEKVRETISFDVVKNFSEDYDGTVPTHPVENGYSLADGVNLSNDKYNISGVVSDSSFDVGGELIQYVDGQFIVPDSASDGIQLDSPSKVFRDRLRSMRTRKEHFGVIISQNKINVQNAASSQVELIYPCIITKLSFSDDGSEAVYPNISFEKVRVATTSFVEVKNPIPELIPYAKDAVNVGDKTGMSASAEGVSNTEMADAMKIEEAFGKPPQEVKTAEVFQKIRNDELSETAKVSKEAADKASAGTLSRDAANEWIKQEVNRRMIAKHGIAWQARLKTP